MAFSTSTILPNRHLYLVPRRFSHPKGNPRPMKQSLPIPQPPAPGHHPPAFCPTDVSSQSISYKWSHIVHGIVSGLFLLLYTLCFSLSNIGEYVNMVDMCPLFKSFYGVPGYRCASIYLSGLLRLGIQAVCFSGIRLGLAELGLLPYEPELTLS